MTANYPVSCACGATIQVKLTDAGIALPCPSCSSLVDVPNSAKLKASSGDRRPYLSPHAKIRHALQSHEPPFDGVCHHCATAKAIYHTPITVTVLAERATVKSGGVRPLITGGIVVSTPAYEETWESLTFPLLLCDDCQSKCVKQRTTNSGDWGLVVIGVVLAVAALPLVAFHILIGVLSLLFAVGFFVVGIWKMLPPSDQRGDQHIRSWIARIRWVPELIDSGGEMEISVGRSQRLRLRRIRRAPYSYRTHIKYKP